VAAHKDNENILAQEVEIMERFLNMHYAFQILVYLTRC